MAMQRFNPALHAVTAAFALLMAGSAQAEAVSLGVIERNYGSDFGRQLPAMGDAGCGGFAATSVRVTAGLGCSRFTDVFDLSQLDAARITSFSLTLQFTSTGEAASAWFLNPGSGTTRGSAMTDILPLLFVGAAAEMVQTFTFDASLDTFDSILATQRFVLGFAPGGLDVPQSFMLSSATLQAWAAPAVLGIPEPGSLALAGVAVLGALSTRRRRV